MAQDKFPTSLAVGAGIVLAVTAYLVLPTLGSGPDVDMSDAAVKERIKPVGSAASAAPAAKAESAAAPAKAEHAAAPAKVENTAPSAKAEPAPTSAKSEPAALSETKAASSGRTGDEIFNSVCTACHSTGAAGAPKIGDKEAWAPRIAKGVDALLETAIKGKAAMPPRGTCADCSDDELKGAIEYMVSKSK